MENKYVVAYGKVISTKKGVFAAGEDIDASHFPTDGLFKAAIEKGFVQLEAEFIKVKHYRGQIVDDAPKPGVVPEDNPPTIEPEPEIKLKGGVKRLKRD